MSDLEAQAYREIQEGVVGHLRSQLHMIDGILEKFSPELDRVWEALRAKGVPDQRARRDAYLKLSEQVSRLQFPAGWGDDR